MIKHCAVCNKSFKTYPSKVKAGKGKYCSKECCLLVTSKNLEKGLVYRFKKGQVPKSYKGFRFTSSRKEGKVYKELYIPTHPNCTKAGYIREHRYIMEKSIGRYLKKNEEVHHLNANTLDNSLENLQLLTSKEHKRLHLKDTIHKRWYIKNLTMNSV